MMRILLVDDHDLFRAGLVSLLEAHVGFKVVGEAGSVCEAIAKAQELEPDVVLMDIAMPGLGGLEATMEIIKSNPQSKVLVLTQYEDSEYIFRFLKAGASGYVLKKAVGTDLVSAIRAVSQGKSYIDSSVADQVIKGFLNPQGSGEQTPYDLLSDREKTVFKLVAEGYTSREIADTLTLSIKTVMTHRANIMEKLGFHNRAELIKFAIRQGLISSDS